MGLITWFMCCNLISVLIDVAEGTYSILDDPDTANNWGLTL